MINFIIASVHEIQQLEAKKEEREKRGKNCRSGNRIGFCSYFFRVEPQQFYSMFRNIALQLFIVPSLS